MDARISGGLLIALCGLITACSDKGAEPASPAAASAPQPVTPQPVTPQPVAAETTKAAPQYRQACELVTEADMATILGSPVTAEVGPHSVTQSQCTYKSAAAQGPYVELEVDRGEGEEGMQGAQFAQSFQKGVADPYAGVGDKAFAAGPALFIRTGDDLVKIVVMGVKDRKAVVKKILDTAKAGM